MTTQEQNAPARDTSVVAPPKRRRRWVSVVLYLLTFVFGTVCGSAITLLLVVRGVSEHIQHPERRGERLVRVLTHRLDLSDEQSERVGEIIRKRQGNLLAIRTEIAPRIAEELVATGNEVDTILNPEQHEKWQAMLHKWRQKWLPKRVRDQMPEPSGDTP